MTHENLRACDDEQEKLQYQSLAVLLFLFLHRLHHLSDVELFLLAFGLGRALRGLLVFRLSHEFFIASAEYFLGQISHVMQLYQL